MDIAGDMVYLLPEEKDLNEIIDPLAYTIAGKPRDMNLGYNIPGKMFDDVAKQLFDAMIACEGFSKEEDGFDHVFFASEWCQQFN